MQYRVIFRSCDGAGKYDDLFSDKQAAIDFANSKQALSDSRGNPYGYSYSVVTVRPYGWWDFVYDTRHPHQVF